MFRVFILSLIFLALAAQSASSLDAGRNITQYVMDSWNSEDGLPQNTVTCLLQTRDGYLWFGTEEGLVRFDGVHFTVFDRYNTKEFRQNRILDLKEDRNGTLWISTYGSGLVTYKNGSFQPIVFPEMDTKTWPVHTDGQGSVWAGLYGSGLYKIQNNKISRFTTQNGLSNDFIFCLTEDASGSLWIGTANGLNSIKAGKVKAYPELGLVLSLFADRDGTLWVGTVNGLFRYKDRVWKSYTLEDGLSHVTIRAIHRDHNGNLWIGTDGGGLNRYHNEKFESLGSAAGLPGDRVWSLYEDREGSLWIGMAGKGLCRLRDGKFIVFGKAESLPSDHVWSIQETTDGRYWFGTQGGVAGRQKDGRIVVYSKKDGLPDDEVVAVRETRIGDLWIGTLHGLVKRTDGKMKLFTAKDGLGQNFPWPS